MKRNAGWLDGTGAGGKKRLVSNREYLTLPDVANMSPKFGGSCTFEFPRGRPVFVGESTSLTFRGAFQKRSDLAVPTWDSWKAVDNDDIPGFTIPPQFLNRIIENVEIRVAYQSQKLTHWVAGGEAAYSDWKTMRLHPGRRHLRGTDMLRDQVNFVTLRRNDWIKEDGSHGTEYDKAIKYLVSNDGTDFRSTIKVDHPFFFQGPSSEYGEKILPPMGDSAVELHVDFVKNYYNVVWPNAHSQNDKHKNVSYRLKFSSCCLNLAVPRLTGEGTRYYDRLPAPRVLNFDYEVKIQRLFYLTKRWGNTIRFENQKFPKYVLIQNFDKQALTGRAKGITRADEPPDWLPRADGTTKTYKTRFTDAIAAADGQPAVDPKPVTEELKYDLGITKMVITWNGKSLTNDRSVLDINDPEMALKRQEQFLRYPPFGEAPNPDYHEGIEDFAGQSLLLDFTANPFSGKVIRPVDMEVDIDKTKGDMAFDLEFDQSEGRVLLFTLIYPDGGWSVDCSPGKYKFWTPLLENYHSSKSK